LLVAINHHGCDTFALHPGLPNPNFRNQEFFLKNQELIRRFFPKNQVENQETFSRNQKKNKTVSRSFSLKKQRFSLSQMFATLLFTKRVMERFVLLSKTKKNRER